MTIRDIAIAIGFDLDEKSLKKAEKTVEKAKKRWEKALQSLVVEIKLKVPKNLTQSGTVPMPQQQEQPNNQPVLDTEQQISEELKNQQETSAEILENQQQIGETLTEQEQKQKQISDTQKEEDKNTQQNVQVHLNCLLYTSPSPRD